MLPSNQALQIFYGTIPLIAAILIGIWINNKRIDDLRADVTSQIKGLREDLVARIEALGKRLDDKIDGLEKRLVERIERLERPIVRG